MAAVAGALLVLADADLRPLRVTEHLRRHGTVGPIELCAPVSADEQDGRGERRALVLLQAVDEQPFAFADAVLLSGNLDDRVGHVIRRSARAGCPQKPGHDTDYERFAESKSSIHSDMGTYSGAASAAAAASPGPSD